MFETAFELMGGSDNHGLTVLQLHNAIQSRKERVTPEFLTEITALLKKTSRGQNVNRNTPLITERLPSFRLGKVTEDRCIETDESLGTDSDIYSDDED
jgi:hypothetical protein